METRLSIWSEVFSEQAERESILEFRHRWVPDVYRILLKALCILTLVCLAGWGVKTGIDRHNANLVQRGRDQVAAEQAAAASSAEAQRLAEEARQREELQALIEQETDAVARLFYGIRNFRAKYSYTDLDLTTYFRAAANRAAARGQDLITVIFEENQFLACSPHNTLDPELQALARPLVEALHNGTLPACDTAYQYAELTPYGIYLVKGYGEERWHA